MNTPELLKLCVDASSNDDIWQEFYNRFNPWIACYIKKAWISRKQPYSEEIISELIQNVYLMIFKSQSLKHFKGVSHNSFLAYLSQVSINAVREHLRINLASKRRGRLIPFDTEIELKFYHSTNPESEIIGGIHISEILNALGSLCCDRDKEIFSLYAIEGFSPAEMPHGLKRTSVESIIRRVKAKIGAHYAKAS